MSETPTVTGTEPTDGLRQLMTLLNESQRYHDRVVAEEGGNGFYIRKGLVTPDHDTIVSFSPAACGLLRSNEERLLL